MLIEKSPCAMICRVLLLISVLFVACEPPRPDDSPFEAGKELGINTNKHLKEASGLAASVRYPGHLWTHNDSGHPAEIFLLDSLGHTRAEFSLEGIKNRDWEDIAMGPGGDSTNYLYVGDIGDNNAQYKVKMIYCVEEPSLEHIGALPVADTLIVRLSDHPHDTEALMVDPVSRNLYLVTKREKEAWLYEIPFPFQTDTLVAQRVTALPIRHIVAGDISRDGSEILIKSYDHIYYWKRLPGQSIPDALKAAPVKLTYEREPMGESIAWAVDASGFYTLGENGKGERGRLYFYKRKNALDSAGKTHPRQ